MLSIKKPEALDKVKAGIVDGWPEDQVRLTKAPTDRFGKQAELIFGADCTVPSDIDHQLRVREASQSCSGK